MNGIRKQIQRISVTDSTVSHLLCLPAMLFIAVGMPLVHPAVHDHLGHNHNIICHRVDHLEPADATLQPAFHNHSAHDHSCTCHNVDHIEPAELKTEDHLCPICNFLATNPFDQSVSTPSIETNGPFIGTAPLVQFLAFKTCSLPGEPRAPPPSHRVS